MNPLQFVNSSGSLRWQIAVMLIWPSVLAAQPPTATKERVAEIQKRLTADYSFLEALYKHLHSNPELSLQEVNTAARLARTQGTGL